MELPSLVSKELAYGVTQGFLNLNEDSLTLIDL